MKDLKNAISEYFQIAFGVCLGSIGLKAFLLPNGFLDGGATGIAILISRETGINISILLLFISLPFLVLGLYKLSRRILIKSIISIIALSVLIGLESFPVITEDKLLIAIFGGMLLGSGIGIAVRNGAVLDGSEILGIYIFDQFGISIGKTILAFNIILFAITAVIVSVEVALYSILTYIVTAKFIDFFIKGFEDFIGITIISPQSKEIEDRIMYELGAGITVYKAASGFGSTGQNQDRRVIQTIINRIHLRKIHRLIDDIDPEAFIVEFDVNNVKGGVLRRYLQPEKSKTLAVSEPA
ncbi:YitT family protein [Dokdonia sinensis]|uniref:YitT family protein n=1 Tax=Dokdonia sinensis TaxID=2479847 RepID=A0A3M0GKU8_9FLAO|nr:YitT family protein [Dokdonia sinensis]RMB63282.1 YitT family protein [Dokdonia sinensis]